MDALGASTMAAKNWHLVLYVGEGAAGLRALEHVRRLCDSRLGRYTLEVVNVVDNPLMAEKRNILAVPTIVRESPPPTKRIVGFVSDLDMLSRALGIE